MFIIIITNWYESIYNVRLYHRPLYLYQIIMKIIEIIVSLTLIFFIKTCEYYCTQCGDNLSNNFYCNACSDHFERIVNGLCVQETTLNGCILYDLSLTCINCQPTFKLESTSCQKVYDGCMIYDKNGCNCWQGSFFNKDTNTCSIAYLNCLTIDKNGSCISCFAKYNLVNGKCLYNSPSCINVDINTGLCTACTLNAKIMGYACIPNANASILTNCYLVDQNSSNYTCRYCKEGYAPYFGNCIGLRSIFQNLTNLVNNCSNEEYFKSNLIECMNISNCLIADLGLKKCVMCLSNFILVNQSCKSIVNSFCQTFDSTSINCIKCINNFYLKESRCVPFPIFCIKFTTTCTQCKDNYQLSNNTCIDPNCQITNSLTGICQTCQSNYKLVSNLCVFVDPNCQSFNGLLCAKCNKGYFLQNGACVFQDLNCLSSDPSTFICTLCKAEFYYNFQVRICIPLPANCNAADISGRCTTCRTKYTLLASYTCVFISPIPNCYLVDDINYNHCHTCNSDYFANQMGVCELLPLFCSQYDASNKICTQCNSNGIMREGGCVDKNCQIFDLKGACLGCIQNYKFGDFGQCQPQKRDPNCKQYLYGVCRSCSERYYFNFQFICVPASPLCKDYDANSGECTSCYNGYLLSFGECSTNIINSVVRSGDILNQLCKQINLRGQCIECYPGYDAIPLTSNKTFNSPIKCVQSLNSPNASCIEFSNTSKCIKCAYRMFLDQNGKCQNIDKHCEVYNQTNGYCLSCYSGYSYTFVASKNQKQCVISSKDLNCEVLNTNGCSKCYSGYQPSLVDGVCVIANSLCAKKNQTNGKCQSCYKGYILKNGICTISSNNLTNSSVISKLVNGCLHLLNGICTQCEAGYLLVNKTCLQPDLNCQHFNSTCLKCYEGYTVYPITGRCVQSTLLIDNCIKYTTQMQCIRCSNGYALNLEPSSCKVIDPNCLLFDQAQNVCTICMGGTVLQGRYCITPNFGVDPNCIYYEGGNCKNCKNGWALLGYQCVQKNL